MFVYGSELSVPRVQAHKDVISNEFGKVLKWRKKGGVRRNKLTWNRP